MPHFLFKSLTLSKQLKHLIFLIISSKVVTIISLKVARSTHLAQDDPQGLHLPGGEQFCIAAEEQLKRVASW
jgi:hypothetical protein